MFILAEKQLEVCVEDFEKNEGSYVVVYTTTYDKEKGGKNREYLHQMVTEKEVMTVGSYHGASRQNRINTGSIHVMFSNKMFSYSHV